MSFAPDGDQRSICVSWTLELSDEWCPRVYRHQATLLWFASTLLLDRGLSEETPDLTVGNFQLFGLLCVVKTACALTERGHIDAILPVDDDELLSYCGEGTYDRSDLETVGAVLDTFPWFDPATIDVPELACSCLEECKRIHWRKYLQPIDGRVFKFAELLLDFLLASDDSVHRHPRAAAASVLAASAHSHRQGRWVEERLQDVTGFDPEELREERLYDSASKLASKLTTEIGVFVRRYME